MKRTGTTARVFLKDKLLAAGLLAGVLLVAGFGFYFFDYPGGANHVNPTDDNLSNREKQFLPWHIEHTKAGNTKVFGLILNQTTLREMEHLYHSSAEVSQFVSVDNRHKIEAYFDKVILGGFSARLVVVIDVPQEVQVGMFTRGSRISNLGGGRKRVTLSTQDRERVYAMPVSSVTYLTRARVDDTLLQKRFGEPGQRIREAENPTTHWLYPDLGLDIALNDSGHAVFQYVSPTQFSKLVLPLSNTKPLSDTTP
jgi:hypothetical protein